MNILTLSILYIFRFIPLCVPDFYLPKYNTHNMTYIEFYGGYPKAWKKKVLKNRLYKAHKIPYIFITPAELRDLQENLVGELGKIIN